MRINKRSFGLDIPPMLSTSDYRLDFDFGVSRYEIFCIGIDEIKSICY